MLKIFCQRMDMILVSKLVNLLPGIFYVPVLVIVAQNFSNIWFILPKVESCVWIYHQATHGLLGDLDLCLVGTHVCWVLRKRSSMNTESRNLKVG